jgi:hypothetical protein
MPIMATTSLVAYLEGKASPCPSFFIFEAAPMPMPKKPLRIVLDTGTVELVAYADNAKRALIDAINLISMQEELRAGCTLKVEEDPQASIVV